MGKKRNLKILRKIANTLPVVMINSCEKHIESGTQLIERGETEVAGKPVNPEAKYYAPQPVQIAINHKRRMNKILKTYGSAGVNAYVKSVKAHMSKEENVVLVGDNRSTLTTEVEKKVFNL